MECGGHLIDSLMLIFCARRWESGSIRQVRLWQEGRLSPVLRGPGVGCIGCDWAWRLW